MATPFAIYDDQYIDDMFLFISLNDEDDHFISPRKIILPTKYAKYTHGILTTRNILERTTSFNMNYYNENKRGKHLYLPSVGLLMVNKKKPFKVKFKIV